MHDGKVAVPLHDAYLKEGSRGRWADHHRHPDSYVEGTNAVRERVNRVVQAHPVPSGRGEHS